MNLRNALYLTPIGLILMAFCIIAMASAAVQNTTITAPHAPGENWTTRDVYQGDTVYWGETVDLSRVSGFRKIVYREGHDEQLIDVSSWTSHIIIAPSIFPVGKYVYLTEEYETRVNDLAFYVQAENKTPKLMNITLPNYTGVNLTQVVEPKLPLPTKQISDILVARGDAAIYQSDLITNESKAWIFGRIDGIYNISCSEGYMKISADNISGLEPGSYKILLISPGKNTIIESLWDESKEQLISPFFYINPLDLKGIAPSVAYDQVLSWMKRNTDDPISMVKMEVQDPAIDIAGIWKSELGSYPLHIQGYTNLWNQSRIYLTLDEDNRTVNILKPERYYTTVTTHNPGMMRQWEVNVPFDDPNTTLREHKVVAHGDYGAYASVIYTVYNMPEGQQKPTQYIKYIAGNEFVPTPTPLIIRETVTQKVIVTQTILVPVTPSNEQVKEQQGEALKDLATNILIGLAILILIWYGISLWARKRKINESWFRWKK